MSFEIGSNRTSTNANDGSLSQIPLGMDLHHFPTTSTIGRLSKLIFSANESSDTAITFKPFPPPSYLPANDKELTIYYVSPMSFVDWSVL